MYAEDKVIATIIVTMAIVLTWSLFSDQVQSYDPCDTTKITADSWACEQTYEDHDNPSGY